jgi:hypothetical protein
MYRPTILACALLLLSSFSSHSADAPSVPDSKQAAIIKLMEITGSDQMGKMFAGMFISQSAQAMQIAYPEMPARAVEVISDVVNQVVGTELATGDLQRSLIPVYDRHFSEEEINALIAFYESPVGQKSIQVMPKLTEESTMVGQTWAKKLSGKLQVELTQRFQQEGLLPMAQKSTAPQ